MPTSPPPTPVPLQAEGFHGELEEFLQWLRRTESQLSAAKPTGGLPETAREQLQQHMVTENHITHTVHTIHTGRGQVQEEIVI